MRGHAREIYDSIRGGGGRWAALCQQGETWRGGYDLRLHFVRFDHGWPSPALAGATRHSVPPAYRRTGCWSWRAAPDRMLPELWIENDTDALHALAVIASALHDPLEHLAAWTVMSVERVASRCRTALRVESGGVLFPCSFFACSRTISVQSGEQTTPIDHIEAILNQHSQERWELIQIEPPSLLIFKQSR